jgi:DNA-binding transcriptional LysR family regulator
MMGIRKKGDRPPATGRKEADKPAPTSRKSTAGLAPSARRKKTASEPIPARRKVDWSDLNFFWAIAEAGSLSEAARRLRTKQSTVSKRLEELEYRLGAQLAIRTRSGIELTDAGRYVAQQAVQMAHSVQNIEHEVSMLDSAPEGEVSFGCPDGLATYFIGPALPSLHRTHPDIQLTVRTRPAEHGLPDLCIQFHPSKRMNEEAISLGWLHHAAFAAPSYLEIYGEPQAIGDAFDHRMLTSTAYVSQFESWRKKQKELQGIIDFALQTDCGPLLLSATAHGGGVASMPTYVAHFEPGLKTLSFGELARIEFWLVFDRERGKLPRVRETIAWIRGIFEPTNNPWFLEPFIHPDEFGAIGNRASLGRKASSAHLKRPPA